jgi:hypothetical protein
MKKLFRRHRSAFAALVLAGVALVLGLLAGNERFNGRLTARDVAA